MNSDSESLQRHLLNLFLAEDAQTDEVPEVVSEDIDGLEHPLDEKAADSSSELELGWSTHTFQLGEIPTVQERFQAVLKRRLQIQIQNQPPLFPWETQLIEYPDYIDSPTLALVPAWGWASQQVKLNLPIPLPEKIFQQLLDKCQTMVASRLPLGAKLVQVVESFFPNESQTLNNLAGLVLRSTYRSVSAALEPNLESDYSDLRPPQQMALSLMAAKQLLEDLTVSVSPNNCFVERQWLTPDGVLTLNVEYKFEDRATILRVSGELPTGGVLKLKGNGKQVTAKSSIPGSLSVELPCTKACQSYTLSVEFPELDDLALKFAINTFE